MEKDNATLPRIIDSVLGAVSVIGSGIQNAYDAWRQKNINMAREVVLKNVRQGDIEQLHQDQFFSMMARFSRSVHEGVAKSNLILMARLISGIGRVDKTEAKTETFAQYASLLEALTYEEIEFLSKCIKAGTVVVGKDELKQSLQQKGFFVWGWSASISNKDEFNITGGNIVDYLSNKPWMTPNIFPRNMFGEPEQKKDSVPYEVNTTIVYRFSEKLKGLLDRYGNLWENICHWDEEKKAKQDAK